MAPPGFSRENKHSKGGDEAWEEICSDAPSNFKSNAAQCAGAGGALTLPGIKKPEIFLTVDVKTTDSTFKPRPMDGNDGGTSGTKNHD